MNKIFCSQWLNGHQIVFGSKCNRVNNSYHERLFSHIYCVPLDFQLSVYDLNKKELFSIPLLRSLQNRQPESQCGIHALAINPSQTILATGAENTNDIAFYSLPTFDPLAIGEVIYQLIILFPLESPCGVYFEHVEHAYYLRSLTKP